MFVSQPAPLPTEDNFELKSLFRSDMTYRVLYYIHEYNKAHPYCPDIREIATDCGISSTSVVNYYLDQLEEVGLVGFLYLRRPERRNGQIRAARTVHVTKRGKAYVARHGEPKPKSIP